MTRATSSFLGLVPALLLLGGCNLFVEPSPPEGSCTVDHDCLPGQRCYVDGCGTLPADLLAEVVTSAPTGVTSVDMPLGPPVANMNLVLPQDQIVELTLRIALCGFFNRFNDSLMIDAEPDAHP